MSADFPAVAEAAATLYPQSGGRSVDGVIVVDPAVVQALMQFTGAVEIDHLDVTVQPDDAFEFIVRDQYVITGDDFQEDRIDGLSVLAEEVTARLLGGALPGARDLADVLLPLAADRHLMVWLAEPAEQALLVGHKVSGVIDAPDGSVGVAVSINNAAGSKIDTFVNSEIVARVESGDDGSRRLVFDVAVHNQSPSEGLPRYVIGNHAQLPSGYHRMLVTFFGPSDLVSATLDGDEIGLDSGTEAGWSTFRHFVDVAPGARVQYRLEFELDDGVVVPDDPADLIAWRQPSAQI